MSQQALDQLITMNAAFKEITGRDAYLYTNEPAPGHARVVFADCVKLSYREGLAWMQRLLLAAQSGDWEAVRKAPVVNPGGDPVVYPYL